MAESFRRRSQVSAMLGVLGGDLVDGKHDSEAGLQEVIDTVDAVARETTNAVRYLSSFVTVLPPPALRRIFWYSALINPPSSSASSKTSHNWLVVLQVCRSWYYIALTDSALMAETYTHCPRRAHKTMRLAGDTPLNYDTTVGCLRMRDSAPSRALRHYFSVTDFDRIGRLSLHSDAAILMHIKRLADISSEHPLLHLTTLIVNASNVPTVAIVGKDETFVATPTWTGNRIHAPRLQTAIFTNFWVPFMSHDLSQLSVEFSANAKFTPTSSDILLNLFREGGGASLRTVNLLNVVRSHHTSSSLDNFDMSFPVLQSIRVHDSPTAVMDLLSKLLWALDCVVEITTSLTTDCAAELAALAHRFEEIPIRRLRFDYRRPPGGNGYSLIAKCWGLFHETKTRTGDEDPQLFMDFRIPMNAMAWVQAVQMLVNVWSQGGIINRLEFEVPSDMYKQTSCQHWQELLTHTPGLARFSPAEVVFQLVASCDLDHGGQVDHEHLLSRLNTFMTESDEVDMFST